MDCEKFEATMLDELYGELDELTVAASKRHVGGCARCSALMAGLRATRKLVTLPVVAPSEGFESRLLSAVQGAEADAGRPRLGFAQFISLAGRWAMRPQTAMAAVFLLMVGTSSLLLTRKAPRSALEAASTSFTVTENGTPAAAPMMPPGQAAASAAPTVDPGAGAIAHGTAPMAGAPSPGPLAFAQKPEAPALAEPSADMPGSFNRQSAPKSRPSAHAASGGGGGGSLDDSLGSMSALGRGNAAGPGMSGTLKKGREEFAPPPPAAAAAAPSPTPPSESKDDGAFAAGKQQYRVGDYPAAAQTFGGLAAGGDTSAALWEARAVRDGAGGCAAAAPKFDQVAGAAGGTTNGDDATFEGARCYLAMGQRDEALKRYRRLLTVPAYAARAQQAINATSQVAAKARAVPMAVAPATAAAPAASPAAPTSPPAARPTDGK